MIDISYKTEDNHLLEYEDIVNWLIFKMKELKQRGESNEDILEYFPTEDFEGEVERIEELKWMILKHIVRL